MCLYQSKDSCVTSGSWLILWVFPGSRWEFRPEILSVLLNSQHRHRTTLKHQVGEGHGGVQLRVSAFKLTQETFQLVTGFATRETCRPHPGEKPRLGVYYLGW